MRSFLTCCAAKAAIFLLAIADLGQIRPQARRPAFVAEAYRD